MSAWVSVIQNHLLLIRPLGRLQLAWQAWEKFWFESNQPANVRLLRQLLGFLLLGFYLIRTLDLNYYYSQTGMVSLQQMDALMPMDYRFSIFRYLPSDLSIWSFNILFLLSLLAMGLNVLPRIATVLAMLLHASFLHRNMSIMFGVDMVAAFFLFYLCFADDRKGPRTDLRAALGSAAFRLMQIQVCIIYAYSGLEKIRGPRWWNGEALWNILANPQLARMDFGWMSHFPLVIVFLTYATLLWEIYFPALIWLGKLRYPMLIFGVLMHVGIGISISIPFFGAIMILTYIVFLREKDAMCLLAKISSPWIRSQAPSSK